MHARVQRLCAWCGPTIVLTFFGGFLISGFIPPTAPFLTADQVKQLYVEHTGQLRLGLILTLLGSGLVGPFVGVISVQLKRIEGRYSPMSYAQLALGVIIMMLLMLPMSQLMTAAYRPERDAQSILVLTDQAWVLFVGCVYAVMIQYLCIAVPTLRAGPDRPVFPRWYGYLNLWCALGSLPGAGIYFVEHGPLAWNGLLAWWFPAAAFGIWLVATLVVLLRAITAQEAGAPDALSELSDADLDRLAARLAAHRAESATGTST